ncbi:hypothetical protein Tco_0856286 [Tanacetum coccineum]|uniref:Ribosomal protein S14 n=1 Tax=Tanacetum coccineum TaxID=301880 RepID=A0ABQ5B4Q3_9ASTR
MGCHILSPLKELRPQSLKRSIRRRFRISKKVRVLQWSGACRRFGFHPTEWQEFRRIITLLGSRRETYYGICLVVPGVQVDKRRFLL